MLEPWEKILLRASSDFFEPAPLADSEAVTIFAFCFVLFLTGLFKYLPSHVLIMKRRAAYYLWGQEGDEFVFWQWLESWYTRINASRNEL